MAYLIGWGVVYYLLIISSAVGNKSRLPAALALIYFLIMAVMRGSVGTDTENYESMVSVFEQGIQFSGVEPGFVIVSWILYQVTESPFLVVRIISLLVVAMAFLFVWRSDDNERFALLAYFIPAFIYSYSMNTLRIGFASMAILLAFQAAQTHSKSRYAYLFSAVMFHYSSLFSMVYIWLSTTNLINKKSVLFSVVAVLLMTVFFYINLDYFNVKLLSYQGSESPNVLSGLSKVGVCLVFLGGLFFSDLQWGEKSKFCSMGLGGVVLFWLLSGVSYAGLRFLDLMSFALPVSILVLHTKYSIAFNRPVKTAFVCAGLLSVFSLYRNFVAEFGQGGAPFMPYHVADFFMFL